MPASIGVNLRVTGHCSQGGRKYMEDFFSVAYQQSEDERDLEYAFIGIYDGHGGSEAATFAKQHLIHLIVSQKSFWSDSDDDILRAIREGYIATHYAMWREQDKWPKTATGLPSTAGTTASIAFIRHGKIYVGHAGDSGIVLGYTEDNDKYWRAKPLTQDHKPECNIEKARIINSGGKVVIKSGVPRVVWNRPRLGHKGPVRRSTPIDEIPFLAVARSLGDLWSYNSALNQFVVSPDPDVRVLKIDPKKFRCLIFGTDGLWNVLSPNAAVEIVRYAEQMNDRNAFTGERAEWINPSKCLVDKALERWSTTRMRADNTSVVILMLDPPGPPKRDVLKSCSNASIVDQNLFAEDVEDKNFTMFDHSTKETIDLDNMPMPTSGLAIMTRYENATGSYDESIKPEFNSASTSCNTDISYMNSFAESYNSLLNSKYDNDETYKYQQHEHEHINSEETYSLTKLETRNELYNIGGKSTYDESTSTSTFAAYQQQILAERYQYDCITSSHLPRSCEVFDNLEDSIQTSLTTIDGDVIKEGEDIEMKTDLSTSTSKLIEDKWCSSITPTDTTSLELNGPTEASSRIDETIQIHEISSSSKENEDKKCKICSPLQRKTKQKESNSNDIYINLSERGQDQRMTRSRQFTANTTGTEVKKPKTKVQNLRNTQTKTITIIKPQSGHTVKVQNENIIVSRVLRGNQTNSSELNKRTLRSKNYLAKDVPNKKQSSSVLSATSKPKFKTNIVKSKNNQHVQMIVSNVTNGLHIARTLQEKSKSNQKSGIKPKHSVKHLSKRLGTTKGIMYNTEPIWKIWNVSAINLSPSYGILWTDKYKRLPVFSQIKW